MLSVPGRSPVDVLWAPERTPWPRRRPPLWPRRFAGAPLGGGDCAALAVCSTASCAGAGRESPIFGRLGGGAIASGELDRSEVGAGWGARIALACSTDWPGTTRSTVSSDMDGVPSHVRRQKRRSWRARGRAVRDLRGSPGRTAAVAESSGFLEHGIIAGVLRCGQRCFARCAGAFNRRGGADRTGPASRPERPEPFHRDPTLPLSPPRAGIVRYGLAAAGTGWAIR